MFNSALSFTPEPILYGSWLRSLLWAIKVKANRVNSSPLVGFQTITELLILSFELKSLATILNKTLLIERLMPWLCWFEEYRKIVCFGEPFILWIMDHVYSLNPCYSRVGSTLLILWLLICFCLFHRESKAFALELVVHWCSHKFVWHSIVDHQP